MTTPINSRILLVLGFVALTSCTYNFKEKQDAYNSAVFSGSRLQQEEVLENLTPAYIATLDPKLQANAWTIRSVAAWQAKRYPEAKQAADRGLPKAIDQSRDEIVLKSIYGLIPASEAMDTWTSANPKTEQVYRNIDGNLKTSWRKLGEAESAAGSRTARSVVDWLHFNKAAVAQNWASIITELRTIVPTPARRAIREDASSTLGGSPQSVSDAEAAKISEGSPLRAKLNRR